MYTFTEEEVKQNLANYKDTFEFFNRDTRRKRVITLIEEIKALDEKIECISEQLNRSKKFAWYLGKVYYSWNLSSTKKELQFINDFKEEILNV